MGIGRHLQLLDEFYSQVRNWKESSGEGLENLGDLFLKAEYPHRAAHYYELATRVEPNRTTAYFKLGELSFRMGNYNRTISALWDVLSIEPLYYEVHFDLGRANMRMNNLQLARRHLTAWLNMATGANGEEKVKKEWAEMAVKRLESETDTGTQ